jgi:hypothetical protein
VPLSTIATVVFNASARVRLHKGMIQRGKMTQSMLPVPSPQCMAHILKLRRAPRLAGPTLIKNTPRKPARNNIPLPQEMAPLNFSQRICHKSSLVCLPDPWSGCLCALCQCRCVPEAWLVCFSCCNTLLSRLQSVCNPQARCDCCEVAVLHVSPVSHLQ